MSIIYGIPLIYSSIGGKVSFWPPMLDNFKAYIGDAPQENITLADIPVSDAETENSIVTLSAHKLEQSRAEAFFGVV